MEERRPDVVQQLVMKVNRVFLMLINRISTNYSFASSNRLSPWLFLPFLYRHQYVIGIFLLFLLFYLKRELWLKTIGFRVDKNTFCRTLQNLINNNLILFEIKQDLLFFFFCCLTFAREKSEKTNHKGPMAFYCFAVWTLERE